MFTRAVDESRLARAPRDFFTFFRGPQGLQKVEKISSRGPRGATSSTPRATRVDRASHRDKARRGDGAGSSETRDGNASNRRASETRDAATRDGSTRHMPRDGVDLSRRARARRRGDASATRATAREGEGARRANRGDASAARDVGAGVGGETRRGEATYARADVRSHDVGSDCWLVVGDGVYDATSWVEKHPGGSTILEQYAGRDATDAFMAYHGGERRALARLETLRIGRLVDESAAPPTHLKAFRRMRDAMEGSEKLLKSDLTDYAFIIARLVVLFGGVLACVLSSGAGFKTHMFGAVLLGLFWQQSMFIGHDAGHTSITYDRKKDAMIGWCVGNLFNGVGIAWWMATHNVHHCACNSLECDPDIQHMPVFAVSNKYFGSVYSLYHRRRMTYDRLARTLVRFQHYTFYPIMAVARINLYLQTLIFLIKAKRVRSRAMEFLTLGVFATWLTTLIAQLPVGHKVPFFFLSHAVAGVIHVQICLSHFSRDVFEGRPENDEWVNMQLAGTLDIDCPRWLDWFHGGLQFQTEHHLCPRVPRHKLRAFREDVVKPYAKANGLGLHSVSFWAANAEVFRTLKLAAKQSRWAPHFSSAMHL